MLLISQHDDDLQPPQPSLSTDKHCSFQCEAVNSLPVLPELNLPIVPVLPALVSTEHVNSLPVLPELNLPVVPVLPVLVSTEHELSHLISRISISSST